MGATVADAYRSPPPPLGGGGRDKDARMIRACVADQVMTTHYKFMDNGANPLCGHACRTALMPLVLAVAMGMSACASSGGAGKAEGGLLDSALGVVGLQRAKDTPKESALELPLKPTKLTLRIHAGQLLNTDAAGRPLALITKIYKLKEREAFLQAPYAAFTERASEKAALGDDLIEVKEALLKPGGRHEVVQTLSDDTRYIGVIGLLRAPAEQRWRFLFDAKESAVDGITVGAHACALSVAEGKTVGAAPEVLRLAGVHCD